SYSIRASPNTDTAFLLFIYLIRPPPISTLFPYTTLFRSYHRQEIRMSSTSLVLPSQPVPVIPHRLPYPLCLKTQQYKVHLLVLRSEEHTSELQSRENLVCRLLLEKKKKTLFY